MTFRRVTLEDLKKCDALYQGLGKTIDRFDDEQNIEPGIALTVLAKMYASIGWNCEVDKKSLLSYMATVIDDTYIEEIEDDDR
jgi:hypothetical protein